MAKETATATAVLAGVTMAVVVTMWAPMDLFQAFVGPHAGHRDLPAPEDRFLGARAGAAGGSAAPASSAAGAAAVASLGAAVLAASGVIAGRSRSRRSAVVAARAETPFAGGLIGGQSAFSSTDYNFDPLGIANKCEKFLPWFREAELKHGRICMLAWVGLVVPDFVRIPGPEECYSASVIEAHKACVGADQLGPLFQVFAFCGVIEMLTTFPKITQGLMTLEGAGDYQLGVSFLPKDELKAKEMKMKELKNGRLAMIAFGGGITQAVLSGNGFPWVYAAGRGAEGLSPGLAASVPAAGADAGRGSTRVALRADGGYKMSKSVPFLPVSPALEGYVGEEDGFDPLGFSLALDIRWLREAEIKHGRVSMLATVGWIATDLGLRVPGEPFQVSTVDAHDAMVKFGSMSQMLVWIGYAELFGFLAIVNMQEGKTDRKPGDFGIRTWYPTDAKGQYDMQLKELRNGRLAMLAFGGIVTQAVLTGKTFPFFATGEPRSAVPAAGGSALCGGLQGPARHCDGAVATRALETSKSLPFLPKPQNLKGFVGEEVEFDPLGFSDTFDMKWLREAELKHGRVCMLATVGFYTQQYITWPNLTPTENALDAVYTETAALAYLVIIAGFVEYSSYGGKITMLDMFEGDRVPGDFDFGSGFLKGKSEKDVYEMKLKELNNGRLAMFALAGMVHHNLVVKGPLFPMFPEGWVGPQGTWELDSVTGRLINNQVGGL